MTVKFVNAQITYLTMLVLTFFYAVLSKKPGQGIHHTDYAVSGCGLNNREIVVRFRGRKIFGSKLEEAK